MLVIVAPTAAVRTFMGKRLESHRTDAHHITNHLVSYYIV